MEVKTIGIDLAKDIFHIHGVDGKGKTVLRMKTSRKELPKTIANIKPCLIGMESCGGSNYWARKFKAMEHTVKIMQAKFIKPYVKSNKKGFRPIVIVIKNGLRGACHPCTLGVVPLFFINSAS